MCWQAMLIDNIKYWTKCLLRTFHTLSIIDIVSNTCAPQNFFSSSNLGMLPLLKVYNRSVSHALSVFFRDSRIGWANCQIKITQSVPSDWLIDFLAFLLHSSIFQLYSGIQFFFFCFSFGGRGNPDTLYSVHVFGEGPLTFHK
jgi:hypothetical protein